jgi:hypothetical protein
VSWERRKGSSYYYRGIREGKRVRKIYLGGGPEAVEAARVDAERRAQEQAERTERAEVEQLDAQMDQMCRAVQRLMTAVLYSAGFHQHARGAWRKRRGHPQ